MKKVVDFCVSDEMNEWAREEFKHQPHKNWEWNSYYNGFWAGIAFILSKVVKEDDDNTGTGSRSL